MLVLYLFVGIYRYYALYYLHCYTDINQMVSTRVTMPLYVPDELLSQLRSEGDISRSYYYNGEQFVESDHHSLCPYTDCEGNDV